MWLGLRRLETTSVGRAAVAGGRCGRSTQRPSQRQRAQVSGSEHLHEKGSVSKALCEEGHGARLYRGLNFQLIAAASRALSPRSSTRRAPLPLTAGRGLPSWIRNSGSRHRFHSEMSAAFLDSSGSRRISLSPGRPLYLPSSSLTAHLSPRDINQWD